ncbi:flagellar hook-basal body complex protein, partial [Acinetobacter baumannii]
MPTRAFVVDSTAGNDFSQGPIQDTGRALDVAIQGRGWMAVQTADGGEAYTRNGSFKINENGILQTQNGQSVQGDGGPIT